MTHKRLDLSTALLFWLSINSHRCKIVEHNKCSDTGNCSWTYSSRRVSLLEELISATLFMNSKHHKSDAFWISIQLVVVKKMKYICEHKQNVLSVYNIFDNIFYVFNRNWLENFFSCTKYLFSILILTIFGWFLNFLNDPSPRLLG